VSLHLTLDPTQTFQTLEGIGASLAWSGDPVGATWSEPSKTQLADLLFCPKRGAGLSGVRFNIGAGGAWAESQPSDPWRHPACFQRSADTPFDPTCHAGQQWFLRAAAERGASCRVAFANSPPLWLTRNGRATHDKSQTYVSSNLKPGGELAFAHFLTEVVAYFEAIGLPFTALSPVNEPQWAWEDGTQEGCRFSNEELTTLVRLLRTELDRRGLPLELDLPEAADLRYLIDDDLLPEPYRHGNEARGLGKCREQIKELAAVCEGKVCGHGYWTYDPPEQSRVLREAVRTCVQRHVPGGRFWQSEVCVMEGGRDLGMETALRVARLAHQDFVHADASAWFWWLALSPYDFKDGLIYLGERETILPSKTLWALGNFARFIRPGWQRIHATPTEQAGVYASAWVSPTGEAQALVVVNTTSAPCPITVEGSDLALAAAYVTDHTRSLEAVAGLTVASAASITTWCF